MRDKFPCPSCGVPNSTVVETKPQTKIPGVSGRVDNILRKRKCPEGHRYATRELLE